MNVKDLILCQPMEDVIRAFVDRLRVETEQREKLYSARQNLFCRCVTLNRADQDTRCLAFIILTMSVSFWIRTCIPKRNSLRNSSRNRSFLI